MGVFHVSNCANGTKSFNASHMWPSFGSFYVIRAQNKYYEDKNVKTIQVEQWTDKVIQNDESKKMEKVFLDISKEEEL